MTNFTGQVQVDFAHDPTSASFTWVDITNRARAASYRRGRSYERAQVEAGAGTLKLRNDDGALDPTNAASTYAPNVLPFRRIQHNVTVTGPGTVPIFTGLVERWPQEWDAGYGSAPVEVVDIFAWLALGELRSCYEQEVLVDAPVVFYPLTESAGATSAGDISGLGQPALVIGQIGGAGDVTFAAATGIPTDGASTATMNETLDVSTTVADRLGDYLVAGGTSLWATQNMTVEAVVTLHANLVTVMGRNSGTCLVAAQHIPDGDTPYGLVLQYDAGAIRLQNRFSLAAVGPDLNDGHLHHLAVVNDNGANTTTYYVDGVVVATAASSFARAGRYVMAVGNANPSETGLTAIPNPSFRGGIGYVAGYSAALSGARIAAHNTAARTAFVGETADARIARILGYVGWTATTALDACTTTMLGASDLTGKSPLAAIQEVQTSEGGVFFASKAGVLTYKSRRSRMQTTASAATFGENTAGGEVPYVDIALDFDPTYVYNDVQITRPGASAATASSAASRAHYGQRSLPLTVNIQSDAETLDAANWMLNTSLAPHARVRSVTIDCLATPGAWAAVLPLEVGSRVTIKRRPNSAAPVITVNSFVESIAWDIVDSKRARCTLELSPIPVQALIADDATYGICDSTFVAAW